MISFLFWNIMGNQTATWTDCAPILRDRIVQSVDELGIDVLVVCESRFEPPELVAALNDKRSDSFYYPESNSSRIEVYARQTTSAVSDQFNDSSDGRLSIRRVTTSSNTEILLAATHFQSRLHWTSADQALQATVTQRDVSDAEDVVGHTRTLLVGDLNMNPFDPGLTGPQALNAVMTRDLARKDERTVAGQDYRLFYNPMWGFFGDRTPGPSGTYFSPGSSPSDHYWHVFDQVLLRPSLMDNLREVRILDGSAHESFLTERGRPKSSELSDHLPIMFRLDV